MHDGSITVAAGASRSGKTAWVQQQLKRYVRWLAWDVEGQYEGLHGAIAITSPSELVRICSAGAPGKYAYRPRSLSEFSFWAECAFLFARTGEEKWPNKVHSAIVAEETSDVTSPGKAPAGWGILLRRGIKYGVDIYGISQRPAESDKTIMGNCSYIHCCGLGRAMDRKYMAQEMDIPLSQIESLSREELEYLHKDMRSGKTDRGRLRF
jgi:hypothetical protein